MVVPGGAVLKVSIMLEEKISEIAKAKGYAGQPSDSDEFRALDAAWTAYLEGLGVKRNLLGFLTLNGYNRNEMRIWRNVREDELTVADPLYVTGGNLVLTEEFVVRTMTLGLP
jgi:hypothetical protein